jgi:hypothetical protein
MEVFGCRECRLRPDRLSIGVCGPTPHIALVAFYLVDGRLRGGILKNLAVVANELDPILLAICLKGCHLIVI